MNTFIKASVSVFLVILLLALGGIGYIGHSLSQLKVDYEVQKELATKIEFLNGFMNTVIMKADSLERLFERWLEEMEKEEHGKPTDKEHQAG